MSTSFIVELQNAPPPEREEQIYDSIFKQYERVIVESLITSFGLDALLFGKQDKHGGDVDTIHNVRLIGSDELMTYKNELNKKAYEDRGEYDSRKYHSDAKYIQKNREFSEKKKSGELIDAYTGKSIAPNDKYDTDHVISSKEIHDDPGRVLAELNGVDLANSEENLKPTNPNTNRTKKADSMDEFLEKNKKDYAEYQASMQKLDKIARKSYEAKLARAYYTSPKFALDLTTAAGKVGVSMGARQVLGLVFAEIWFAVKAEFQKAESQDGFDLGRFMNALIEGVKSGGINAKAKYKEVAEKFGEGLVAGALASVTTTLCNIFFTTAKNAVRIIRQAWASLVEAVKILLFNPDNLLFGERFRAATKVLATGASVVLGTLVGELIAKTPVAAIPAIGEIVRTFCAVLTTGILSCTLLLYLDRSPSVNALVNKLNEIPSVEKALMGFKEQAELLEKYAAELEKIDADRFHQQVEMYRSLADELVKAENESELNAMLKNAYIQLGIKFPWQGNFDDFMNDKNSKLSFE